jgi:hypothetical protein
MINPKNPKFSANNLSNVNLERTTVNIVFIVVKKAEI